MKLPLPKKETRGVAILVVMVSLALLMAIVTELSTKEYLRYKLAINERDALQAEALAMSGANFAQLILAVQEPLQAYMANFAKMGLSLPAYAVWHLFPVDSTLLTGMADNSFFPSFDYLSGKKEDAEDTKKTLISEKKSEEVPLFGPYQPPPGGFGGFAGTFSAEIQDEESKISIRKWGKLDFPRRKAIADQIFHIISKREYEPLFDSRTGRNKSIGPGQLVGLIYDYVSSEDRSVDISAPKESFGRDLLGDKRTPYLDNQDIMPKREPMDTTAELRFIPGVNDGIYNLLSKTISIYGEGPVNILTASDEILGSAFYLCAKNKEASAFNQPNFETELLANWHIKKDEGGLEISQDGVIKYLEENGIEVDKAECNKAIGTESKNFTVKSTATVGTVTKTVLVRLRSAGHISTLYQFQYL